MNPQPVILPPGIVAEKKRRAIIDGDQDVNGAVVIEVTECQSTRGHQHGKNGAALCADVLEGFPSVVKQHERLFVSDLAVQGADEVIRIAVGEKQIQVPVIVIVKKFQTPATHEFCGLADAGRKRYVVKCFVMIVFVYGEHFAVEVRHEQVHPSTIVEIGGVHAHAGSRPAAITVSNAGSRGDLIEFSLATIDEEKIGHRVVAYPQVDQSVVVDVGRDHAPYLAEVTGDAGRLADLGERAITVVVEQPAGHGRINLGNTIVMAAVIVDSAGFVEFLAEVHEAPYEQVKAAIIVVVKPHGTGSPTGSGHSRFFRYIGK